jgi:hypothetical protein
MSTFDARDLGEASSYLGISISRDRKKGLITLAQQRMTTDLVQRFGLDDGKVRSIPLSPSLKLMQA